MTIGQNPRDPGAYWDANFYRMREMSTVAEQLVRDAIRDAGIYAHQVSARVKDRDSYCAKAQKRGPDESLKYRDPVTEISDLVGVRVVVSIAADVPAMASAVRDLFDVFEEKDRGSEAHVDRPGYQSRHLVCRLKSSTLDEPGRQMLGSDIAIEIQVRSILQDALASFEHDLIYKAERSPSPTTQKSLVEVASLLHVADRLFFQVRNDALNEAEAAAGDDAARPLSETDMWPEQEIDETVKLVVGAAEADPSSWLRELGVVLSELGYSSPKDFVAVAGQLTDGTEFASRLRREKPWITGSQVLDLLLRCELGENYFDRRAPTGDNVERDAFQQQVADLRRLREELT